MYRRLLHQYLQKKGHLAEIEEPQSGRGYFIGANAVQAIQRNHIPEEGYDFTRNLRELEEIRRKMEQAGASKRALREVDDSISQMRKYQISEATGAFYSMGAE